MSNQKLTKQWRWAMTRDDGLDWVTYYHYTEEELRAMGWSNKVIGRIMETEIEVEEQP